MLNSKSNKRIVKLRFLAGKIQFMQPGFSAVGLLTILLVTGLNSSRAQNTWTQKANFGGSARTGAVGFSIGSKGYIGTGGNDFWEYDSATNAWTQKANFGGAARAYAAGFSIGTKGYIGTGQGSTYYNDFWEYDPSANAWTQKAHFPGTARLGAAAFTINDKGYIGTGYDGSYKNDFYQYDPATNLWSQKANFGGSAREYAVGLSIGSKGYIGTGTNNKNDFWEYDPSTNLWTQKANFGGSGRMAAAAFVIGSKGYVGTGKSMDGFKNDFWAYDPSANTWTQQVDFGGTSRAGAAAFSIGSNAYIGTGFDDNGFKSDFWEFSSAVSLSIITGSVSGSPFCPEAALNVPFTSTGTFNGGNIYTAQLSDKQGSFAAPIAIGTLASTANSGTIAATIPSKPKAGSKYRIRVTSSDPAVTGSDNGTNLQLIACAKVTALSASSVTSNSAALNWTGVSCTSKYKIQYRKQGTSGWTTQYSTTNTYTITGLLANTTYEYHVETYCSESGSSNSGYTTIQTFTTSVRLGSGLVAAAAALSIYPNPAEDVAVIQFTLPLRTSPFGQSSHVYIKMYDLSGKEIETLFDDDVEQGDHSLLLNTNHFSKGVYLVKLISDFGIENQKFMVQ